MFVLAWLNIATQPCLMAMEMTPEVTPAHEPAAHSGHAGHMSDETGSADCGHCPPAMNDHEVLCETGLAAGCEIFPGYNVDGRQFKQQLKDIPPPLLPSAIGCSPGFSIPVTLGSPQDLKRLKFADDPPLIIRHCVFLK